jgi:MFS transporter, ACS family, D-galactonate transporter
MPDDSRNYPIPRRRWRIAFLLGLGVLVNYFDRVNLSVSHAALVSTFGISMTTFGYLSSAYNLTYAMCQLPVGVILDGFGVRRVGRLSTFIWSVASFSAAVTPNVGGFFAARFLLGVGEAPTFPANAKATGRWFPRQERSLATSIFDSMAKFSSAIGVPVIGVLLLHVGWRWSFAATGLVSLLYFALFTLVYRDRDEDPGLTAVERRFIIGDEEDAPETLVTGSSQDRRLSELVRSLLGLIKERKVLGLAIGFGSYNYVFYLLLTWLPTYLSSALHIDLFRSFVYTAFPWIVATVTDLLVGGWLVDALIQRGWNDSRVRQVVLISGTALGLGIFGAAYSHTATQALAWISVSIGGLAAAAPVGWSLPSMIAPSGRVGEVGGIVNFSNQLSGIAAPIITGYLVTATHSFGWAFGVAAAYLVLGIASYIFLLARIERIPEKSTGAFA